MRQGTDDFVFEKRSRVVEECVMFWKINEPNEWLSNWSTHGFTLDAIYFQTAEHYLMFSKAMLMGDEGCAKRILKEVSLARVKSIGREVKHWNEQLWVENREAIMVRGLQAKAEQHPDIARSLLETDGKLIVEASPLDKIWGIGLRASDPRAADPSQWKGLNVLGQAWMRVRQNLLQSAQVGG